MTSRTERFRDQEKPKLLFFQYSYDQSLPSFLLNHKREHVECLSRFFDVVALTSDCDYDEVCERYRPDMVLFESGVPFATCRRPDIRNIRAHPQILKAGLLHSDAFCEARAGFLSDMERWGVETFFAIATTAGEYTPALHPNLFIWPNFVDPSVYRDYGESKNIPVLFTGSTGTLYPWRKGVLRVVSARYPSLICPHPGYSPNAELQPITGQRYARMLNASTYVPACGTVAKELVRKHLEVPACRSCLITEDSPTLRAAGFADMVNCVFATESDVIDKLQYLSADPDKLEGIVDAGYRLVHSQHTIEHRNQLRQWFDLRTRLKPGEKIIQPELFAPLTIARAAVPSPRFASNGLHIDLLRQGDSARCRGRYEEAERYYSQCLQYYRFMPEPQLRLALCRLLSGDPEQALAWLEKPLTFILSQYKSPDPDPVEWAYFIIALLCAGRLREAVSRAEQFDWLHHPELDRARVLAGFLSGEPHRIAPPGTSARPIRASIHRLDEGSWSDWLAQIQCMLEACRQTRFADALPRQEPESTPSQPTANERLLRQRQTRSAVIGFQKRLARSKRRERARRSVARALHAIENRVGYFLPYRLSVRRRDPFFTRLESLLEEQHPRDLLAIGSKKGKAVEALDAISTGLKINRALCSDFVEAEQLLRKRQEEQLDRPFDLILLDGSRSGLNGAPGDFLRAMLLKARFVFLYNISRPSIRPAYFAVLYHRDYLLLDQRTGMPQPYAIFELVPKEMVEAPLDFVHRHAAAVG
jgi:tetratricopeptide (TPR) repeat protein